MLRRVSYGCIGGLLSTGAPVGLLAVRSLQHRTSSLRGVRREVLADPAGYAYVGASTAIAFTLFGFLLGRQADRLADLSQTDALTGLRNARGLSERLHDEIVRFARYQQPLALLLVDLDGLKRINDRFGHRGGDLALRQAAAAIRTELRASDTGARWGGDEFAIVAPNTTETAALALGERIRAQIARQDGPHRLTASIGVTATDALRAAARIDGSVLMHRADVALYEAKRRGRNTVARLPYAALPHTFAHSSGIRGRHVPLLRKTPDSDTL